MAATFLSLTSLPFEGRDWTLSLLAVEVGVPSSV